jgi:hypothetical protein
MQLDIELDVVNALYVTVVLMNDSGNYIQCVLNKLSNFNFKKSTNNLQLNRNNESLYLECSLWTSFQIGGYARMIGNVLVYLLQCGI